MMPTMLLPDRFKKSIVVQPTGCWLWTGARKEGPGTDSYGVVWWQGAKQYAHRVIWGLSNGPVPAGQELDHLCEVRPCVNPAHLEAVDRPTNLHRSQRFWATRPRALLCKRGHPFTPENTIIRKSNGSRSCRTCQRANERAYAQRQRAKAHQAGGDTTLQGGEGT